VGILRCAKGIETFLEIPRIVRERRSEVPFLAVGAESSVRDVGWFLRMRKHAEDLGLADVVRFPGFRADIAAVMRSFDVLVVPSRREAFERVMDEGATGFLAPVDDAPAFADALLRVIGDE